MHVKVEKIPQIGTGAIISIKRLKSGVILRGTVPKDGYWKVVWIRKRGTVKAVSGILTKRKAHSLADLLNSLSHRQVSLLVKALHAEGATLQRESQRKNQLYTGRSFARE